jgi:hypothetical protein
LQLVKKYSTAATFPSRFFSEITCPSWLIKEKGLTLLIGGIPGLVKPGIIEDITTKKPTTSAEKKIM